MGKKSAIFLLVIALAGGGYYFYRTRLSASFLDKKKMEVRGKEYKTWSKQARERTGLKLRRIANKDNAAVLYVQASNAEQAPKGSVEDKMFHVLKNTWSTDRDFTDWYDRNSRCLTLIHAAVRKPHCEFPVFGSDEKCAYAIELPMEGAMRQFARLLVCEGKRREHEADHDGALGCYFAAATVAAHLRESDAPLITELVAIACQAIRNRAMEVCVGNASLSPDQLGAVIAHYANIVEETPTFRQVMRGERMYLEDTVDQIVREPDALGEVVKLSGAPTDARVSRELEAHIRMNGDALRRSLDKSFELMLQWGSQPPWIALRPENHFARYVDNLPKTDVFSAFFLRGLAKARDQFAKLEATNSGILIFAAIKLYEKKNGRPPGLLADLKGEYISDLPKDPFSGNDYVYKVRGTDWILYSVWDNLIDDNGAGSWPHDLDTDKDLIWRNTPIPIEPAAH